MATNDGAFNIPLIQLTGIGSGPYTRAEFTLPLAEVSATGTHKGGDASIELPLLEVSTSAGLRASIELPAPTLSSHGEQPNVGNASINLPSLEVSVRAGLSATNSLPVLTLNAHGYAGNLGTSSIELPAPTLSAHGSVPLVGNASITLPLPQVTGTTVFDNRGTANITLPRIDIDATGIRGILGSAGIELPLIEISATGYINSNGNASITLPLLVVEARGTGSVIITSQIEETESETFAVSVNLSNRCVSEYVNYKFNSQTYFNGKYIGANTSGIFDLTGDDDAGTDIAAKIRTGLDDVGSFNLKRVWGVYLSYNGEALRIKTATVSEDFDAIGGAKNRSSVSVQKFKPQRTKRDSYWGVEVENVGGTDFEINGMEVICEVLNRRAL